MTHEAKCQHEKTRMAHLS